MSRQYRLIDPMSDVGRHMLEVLGAKSQRDVLDRADNASKVSTSRRFEIRKDGAVLGDADTLDLTGVGLSVIVQSGIATIANAPDDRAPTYTLLTSAGTTATATIAGDDISGLVTLTPNGVGIAAGTVIEVDFAVSRPSTNYSVNLTRQDLIAGAVDARVTGQTGSRFRIYSTIALTAGSTYAWFYHVRQYLN